MRVIGAKDECVFWGKGKAEAKPEVAMLNVRLNKALVKRVKVRCIEKELTVQQFVTEALTEYLKVSK